MKIGSVRGDLFCAPFPNINSQCEHPLIHKQSSKAKLYNPEKGISRKSFLKGRFFLCSEFIQGIEFQFKYTTPEVNCAKQQQQLSLSTLHAQEGQQPIPPTPRGVEQPIHSTPRWQGAVLLCQLHFQTSRSNIFRHIFPSFFRHIFRLILNLYL